jgi:hypothetical protein
MSKVVSNCPGEPLQDPCSLWYVIYSLTIRDGEMYNMSAKIMFNLAKWFRENIFLMNFVQEEFVDTKGVIRICISK